MNVARFTDAAVAFLRNLHNPEFLRRLALSGRTFERVGKAPTAHVLELYPELASMAVTLGDVEFHGWNMDPFEVYCLVGIASVRRPRQIFEFGTYDGMTTTRLAVAAPEAQIWTLDLPEDGDAFRQQWGDQPDFKGLGARYREAGLAGRVTQLQGDSRMLDVSPWLGAIDLVVVDGGHAYDVVKSDSLNAVRMLAPGGVIVWDDYAPTWFDVVRAVDEVAAAAGLDIVRVAGTEIAVHDPHARQR